MTRKAGPKKSARVTLQDIAQAAGVHYTTISLALKDSPKLPAVTRRRIKRLAQRLGYTPDPMLSALSFYRHSQTAPRYKATLAWINNWDEPDHLLYNSTYREYYDGACDRARQLGYLLEEYRLRDEKLGAGRVVSILKARNISGLLIFPQRYSGEKLLLDCRQFSTVAFGYSLQPPVYHVVSNHHYHSITMLIGKMVEMGYRRLGLSVGVDSNEKVENAWVSGFHFAASKHPGVVALPPCDVQGDRIKAWMKQHKPDAMISYNYDKGVLRNLGYKIPRDLGFASLDTEPSDPETSGVKQNNFYIGQKAIDVLIGLLHRGERGIPEVPTRLLVEGTWVPGKTLRKQ